MTCDLLDRDSTKSAFLDVDVAYYLVHSMGEGEKGFAERDRLAASNFASAAKAAGVKKVIYLGGLGASDEKLSHHLKSRHETGDILRAEGPPVLEFRAGIIVGSGSASFEIIRDLAEKLPIMICPQWVTTRVQPIAIADVLSYLVAGLEHPELAERIIEIGGASVESYRSMMLGYAAVRGLRRYLIQVPVLTPRLSSYWLDLVTPIPSSITRPLIEGLRTEVICRSQLAQELLPGIEPMDYRNALEQALQRNDPGDFAHTFTSTRNKVVVVREGLISDARQGKIAAPVSIVREVLHRLGGENRWPYADWLWRLRGVVDKFFGGVGMRRSLKRVLPLKIDDQLDFWRVQECSATRLLLTAEMKVPGKAWLQFQFTLDSANTTMLRMIASFEPRGVFGFLYWWALYPAHSIIFEGMIRSIARTAEQNFLTASMIQSQRELDTPTQLSL